MPLALVTRTDTAPSACAGAVTRSVRVGDAHETGGGDGAEAHRGGVGRGAAPVIVTTVPPRSGPAVTESALTTGGEP